MSLTSMITEVTEFLVGKVFSHGPRESWEPKRQGLPNSLATFWPCAEIRVKFGGRAWESLREIDFDFGER
jgi:hypothetical protein